MIRTLAPFLLALLTPVLASSQVVEDTLDWHRYFPLEIGNEWQYVDAESGPSSKFVIRTDTLVEGTHYFIGRETYYIPGGDQSSVYSPREVFLRYDTTGVVAEFDSPDADTGFIPIEFERGFESFPVVDLRADFGANIDHPDGTSGQISVAGGYDQQLQFGNPRIVAIAEKSLSTTAWFWSFATDIGFTGGGNLWGPRLQFARIGGVEYGAVFLSAEDRPTGDRLSSGLAVYPNPATQLLSVEFIAQSCLRCSVTIIDALGRSVQTTQIVSTNATGRTFDVSTLAAGIYFVRLQRGAGETEQVHSFLITR